MLYINRKHKEHFRWCNCVHGGDGAAPLLKINFFIKKKKIESAFQQIIWNVEIMCIPYIVRAFFSEKKNYLNN